MTHFSLEIFLPSANISYMPITEEITGSQWQILMVMRSRFIELSGVHVSPQTFKWSAFLRKSCETQEMEMIGPLIDFVAK